MGEVKLYRAWRSPFSWRVEIALKLKGIEYEVIDVDLSNKSDELLMYNPVHKKIPVLVHNGKSVSESLVILEYIDETWKDNYPLLPSDPYDRAQARFWAKFIDDKVCTTVWGALMGQEDNKEKAQEEVHKVLKILENKVKAKDSIEGKKVGYLDIVGLIVGYWAPIMQEVLGKEVGLNRDTYPSIYSWTDGLVGLDYMKNILPKKDELVAAFRTHFASTK
ncbi:glutathione S-transferase U8-like [Silene latifolia]|uniref:glutathione S-transferase U8-like n=1 Tax=Silene latifolia TaxID=37657 RepID=UPI003D780A85